MDLKKQAAILKELELDTFPRSVGVPHQHIVHSPKQFLIWLQRAENSTTCYTSHNSYTEFNDRRDPTVTKVKNIFLDFDKDEENDLKFKHVARDVKLVDEYLSDQSITHSIVFSGRAGYHIYIHVDPTREPLDNGLSLKYRGIYDHLQTELNLKTLDKQCAEPKRLCRVPGSTYIKRGIVTDRKCFPLPEDMSIISNKDEIYKKSHEEIEDIDFKRGKRKLTVDQLINKWDINPESKTDKEYYDTIEYSEPDSNFLKLAGEFFRPCIENMLFKKNPPHFIRFSSCVLIKEVFSLEGAIKFYDKLSEKVGWIDKRNRKERVDNIKQIYKVNYELPKCGRIMKSGYCIGEECEYWDKEMEEGDVDG